MLGTSGYSAIVAMDPPQEGPDVDALSCVMNPATADMLHFATDYARRGWPVFPCNPINKHPLTKHGFKDASTDPEQIKQWWTKWPLAMIGVPMGAASGVVAIDPDAPKDDNDQDGRKNWALLLAQHGGIYTHTHLTPGEGKHVLFRYDPERPLSNSEGGLEGKNINVRGDGGYIIVPPSQRGDGKRYDIADTLDFFNFAPIPEWLHEILEQKSEPSTKPSISQRAAEQMYAQRSVNGPDTHSGDTFFKRVNSAALRNLSAWVPAIFPQAEFQPGTGAYRISSKSLGRDLEEDLSIAPSGAKDWGVWDIGDPRRGKRTPIDILIQSGQSQRPSDAALWLCERIGVDPQSLGWEDASAKFGAENLRIFAGAQKQSDEAHPVDPVDLWAELATPSLPEGALPEAIDNMARHQGALMGVDPGGLATACLTVCAAAIPDNIKLQVKEHDPNWTKSARLWSGLVGLPSTKKSPLTGIAVAPLQEIDAELYKKYAEAIEEHSKLPAQERKVAKKPTQRRVVLQDVTTEHAQEVLQDSPDGILVFHDELAGFFGSLDRYNASSGASAS